MMKRFVSIMLCCLLLFSMSLPALAAVTYEDGRDDAVSDFSSDRSKLNKKQQTLMEKLMELFRKLHEDVLALSNKANEEVDKLIEKTLDKVDYWVRRIRK